MFLLIRITSACLALLFTQYLYAEADIDEKTGLIVDEGVEFVKNKCTVCHSSKLIIQNRANYHGWQDTLRWMQKNQGMQPLDLKTERQILNYLAKNYAPEKKGRRIPLVVERWYPLEDP